MKRRSFLQGAIATSTLSTLASAGLLIPQAVLAANYPAAAFDTENSATAVSNLFGSTDAADSANITLKAPEVAENGAVVPIKVSTNGPTEMIAVVVEENPRPLVMSATFGEGASGYLSGRIKMGKTSKVVAYAKMNGQVVKTMAEVKVTAGGCGG
ncbi:MAG: sulfur-oxidizing protein SoxY [Saprospiraceae bacterium]|jgi:sulfur-oxidizing protein SoxY